MKNKKEEFGLRPSIKNGSPARDKKIVQSPPVDYQPLTKVAFFQATSSATAFPLQFRAIFSVTNRMAGTYRQHSPPLDKTHRVETQIFFRVLHRFGEGGFARP
jgi:hypothetical protein